MSALLGHAPVARPTEPTELTQYLYENYGQRVFTFCYSRLRDREEAQDAAQTTFIYVLRSLQRGVEPEFDVVGTGHGHLRVDDLPVQASSPTPSVRVVGRSGRTACHASQRLGCHRSPRAIS